MHTLELSVSLFPLHFWSVAGIFCTECARRPASAKNLLLPDTRLRAEATTWNSPDVLRDNHVSEELRNGIKNSGLLRVSFFVYLPDKDELRITVRFFEFWRFNGDLIFFNQLSPKKCHIEDF